MFSLLGNLDFIDPRVTLPVLFGGLAIVGGAVVFADISGTPEPAFSNGQMVRMKAFDVTGMVTGGYCVRSGCTYYLRTGPKSTLAVREFEIEAI